MKQLLILFLFVSGIAFGQQVKHKIVDNQIFDSQGLQQPNIERFTYSDGWRDEVIPKYDSELQYLGERYYNQETDTVTWAVINFTSQELSEKASQKLDAIDEKVDVLSLKRILQKLVTPIIDTSEILTQQQLADLATIHPQFRVGVSYINGQKVVSGGKLYEVIQPHTSQLDWLPEIATSLFKEITPAGIVAEWKQPAGEHDSYQIGDKVLYNGSTWESTTANNVWAPGVYGWVEK